VADLVIDGALLRSVADRVTTAAAEIALDASYSASLDAELGSSAVASALRDAGIQQRVRADAVAHSLLEVGASAAASAAAFEQTDRRLSGGL